MTSSRRVSVHVFGKTIYQVGGLHKEVRQAYMPIVAEKIEQNQVFQSSR